LFESPLRCQSRLHGRHLVDSRAGPPQPLEQGFVRVFCDDGFPGKMSSGSGDYSDESFNAQTLSSQCLKAIVDQFFVISRFLSVAAAARLISRTHCSVGSHSRQLAHRGPELERIRPGMMSRRNGEASGARSGSNCPCACFRSFLLEAPHHRSSRQDAAIRSSVGVKWLQQDQNAPKRRNGRTCKCERTNQRLA
jgi:hypothetical protein